MPRIPRKKSYTNVYHIIIRGINRQDIFLDKHDYRKMLKEIINTKEKYKYEIYAFVLMPNHVHFVINDKNNNVSTAMQSLSVRYSNYFNKKYERVGHVFENRFKSHVVEDESYLKNVVRYIHKNPENAGITSEYPWNSYYEYIFKPKIIDAEFVMQLFSNNIEDFKYFHQNYNKNSELENCYEMIKKIDDNEAIAQMKEILQENNLMNVQNYETNKKRKAINKVIKIEGIKKVQIARILGINRKTIEKIGREMYQKGQINQKETSLKEYGEE